MRKRMKAALLITLVIGMVMVFPVGAQDSPVNTVNFNGVSFAYDAAFASNVTVTTFAGDDPALQQPGATQPPYVEFRLFNAFPNESLFDVPLALRVYDLAAMDAYTDSLAEVDQLRALLADRPDLTTFEISGTTAESALPFLPVPPAAQVVRALTSYVDTPQLSGIAYVTSYRQDASPLLTGDLFYTVQALSANDGYYVVGVLNFETSLFPADLPADFNLDDFVANIDAYFDQSIVSINQADASAFTPSLNVLTDVINTLSLPPVGVMPEMPPAPTTEPDTSGSLGGLAGEWALVSYGPADAPTAPVASELSRNAPTIRFDAEGVTGSTGCNTFGGTFTFDNTAIDFGNLFSTMMACEGLMEQEQALLSALNSATSYTVSPEGVLQIVYDGGVLVFNRLAPAETAPTPDISQNTDPTFGGLAGDWVLREYTNAAGEVLTPLADAPVTITFAAEGVNGNAGCNTFRGTFTYNFGALTFSPLVTTRMACANEAANAQETAVLAALETVQSFSIGADGSLVLIYDSGRLTFSPAR